MTIDTPQDFDAFKSYFLAALCVWREARGESREGKRAVWNVIKNRCADLRWPDNLADVVTQPYQFSSFNTFDSNASKWPHSVDESWLESVDVVMKDEGDNTNGAVYYFASYIKPPYWSAGLSETVRIGKHVFMK